MLPTIGFSVNSKLFKNNLLTQAIKPILVQNKYNSTFSKKYIKRRALFNVPGSEDRKILASLRTNADSIVFDLEDGVAYNRKKEARTKVFNALEKYDLGHKEKAVRINCVSSGLAEEDLKCVLPSSKLEALVITKVNSEKDIHFVCDMIDDIAPENVRKNIRLIACVESAMSLVNLRSICTSDPRVDALVFASEDYCADTGMIRTRSREELTYARQALVAHAHAFNLQAIDLVCQDYKNDDILREECQEGKEFGFTGKQAIHPRQIDIIQEMFTPNQKDLEYARRILDGFKNHTSKGIGAFVLDGKMIDQPVVRWAEKLISRA